MEAFFHAQQSDKEVIKQEKNLIGFMRATEVTVNKTDNSYNQHMHVLLCVENTYFKNTENYMSQKQWIGFWKRAMKLDYDLIVDVRVIKPKNKYKSDLQSAIDETCSGTLVTNYKVLTI